MEEGRLHDGPHVFGLFWTKDKLEWYFDGKKIRTVEGNSPQKPLFWQLESEIIENLNQGVDSATTWPTYCEFDYVRHFAIDDVNEACMPKDKVEQEKCEKMYQGKSLDMFLNPYLNPKCFLTLIGIFWDRCRAQFNFICS